MLRLATSWQRPTSISMGSSLGSSMIRPCPTCWRHRAGAGNDGEFVASGGEGGVFSGAMLSAGYNLYATAAAAQAAIDLYGEFLSSRHVRGSTEVRPKAGVGVDPVEGHGSPAQPEAGLTTFTVLVWRHVRMRLDAETQGPIDQESASLLSRLATALDARYQSDSLPYDQTGTRSPHAILLAIQFRAAQWAAISWLDGDRRGQGSCRSRCAAAH